MNAPLKHDMLGMQPDPGDLMHEDTVYERYKHLLAERELREARKSGQIEWYDLRKGPHYTVPQLMRYFDRYKRQLQCENQKLDPARDVPTASSRSETSGSDERKASKLSIITGMTPQLEERAARLLDSET